MPSETTAAELIPMMNGRTATCVGCGYDLRTLSADANCPECGIPVIRSIADAPLRYAPREWVAQVASAFNWHIASRICLLLYAALFTFLPYGQVRGRLLNGPLPAGLFVASVLLDALAVWYVTTPDRTLHEVTTPSLRQWCRLLVFPQAALSIGVMLFTLLQPTRDVGRESGWIAGLFVSSLVTWTASSLWFLYVHRIVAATARPGLALQWGGVMVLYAICFGLEGVYPAAYRFAWLFNLHAPAFSLTLPYYGYLGSLAYTLALCWLTRDVLQGLAGATDDAVLIASAASPTPQPENPLAKGSPT